MSFCDDVYNWMDEDSKNVIVVHCKGGKGLCIRQLSTPGLCLYSL